MRYALLLSIALTSSCKLASSLVSFEGEIEMSTSLGSLSGGPMSTLFTIKGDKVRMESKGLGSFASITDVGAKKTWMLDTTAHTYSEVDLSTTTAGTPKTTKSTMKVSKTGKSDKIAGYSCDVYEVTDPASGMRTNMCMASGLRMISLGLSGPFSTFAKSDDAWSEVMSHGFPLRMSVLDASGVPLTNMEATRIEKKSVPDSEVTVPAGYTKTKI